MSESRKKAREMERRAGELKDQLLVMRNQYKTLSNRKEQSRHNRKYDDLVAEERAVMAESNNFALIYIK